MKRIVLMTAIVVAFALGGIARGEDSIWTRDTLTEGFWGLNDQLAEEGMELALGVTQVYQQNVHGGTSTHRRAGRYGGAYDLELTTDLEQLLGIEGASFYMHAGGSWSKSGEIDTTSVGSTFGVNGAGAARRDLDLVEAWYEQAFDNGLILRAGKLDIGGGFECRGCPASFDGSLYANDETGQFLNGALVNNPTIPFPDQGIGAIAYYNPIEWWYASAGLVDAQADNRETGFNTAFSEEDYFFYIFETGIAPQMESDNGPLQGVYRVGMWIDGQDKARFSNGKNYRDDMGFYTSCDQLVVKENGDPEDIQGLGVFGRYGWARSDLNALNHFFSVGMQYQGLIDGCDDDVLGVGYAHGTFTDYASEGFTEDNESVLEVYYSMAVSPWLSISPSVQFVSSPGGDKTVSDATVLGLRAQMTF